MHSQSETRLRITEIFYSLQGESSTVGWPTVFIRLTGCPLRCTWCDTPYSFHGGNNKTLPEIMQIVAQHRTRHVCVTGGEPLAQKACLDLLLALCDAGYEVSLETSGALDISHVDPRVKRVMDIKAPGSGEVSKNLWSNLAHLNARDEIKIVLADEADYLWACDLTEQKQLTNICPILFSPVADTLNAKELAEWILRDQLAVRMQVQMHKIIWGNTPGH